MCANERSIWTKSVSHINLGTRPMGDDQVERTKKELLRQEHWEDLQKEWGWGIPLLCWPLQAVERPESWAGVECGELGTRHMALVCGGHVYKWEGFWWELQEDSGGRDTIWFIFDKTILDAQKAAHAGNTDFRVRFSQQLGPGSRWQEWRWRDLAQLHYSFMVVIGNCCWASVRQCKQYRVSGSH